MQAAHPATSHFFTVDVEEYFQVKALESVVSRDEWLSQPSRLARTVGPDQPYRAFLQSRLLDAIGMTSAKPDFDPAGTWVASSTVYATARDFARFGLLYLRDGMWDGQRLLPEGWVDVTSVSDLAEVAAELRANGREMRVATKYANLTRQFMYDRGITYFELVEVSGAIEAAPALETADIICDITSSGVTLRENRLKMVSAGVVLESQACLIGNRRGLAEDAERLDRCPQLLERGRFERASEGHRVPAIEGLASTTTQGARRGKKAAGASKMMIYCRCECSSTC